MAWLIIEIGRQPLRMYLIGSRGGENEALCRRSVPNSSPLKERMRT